jgi:1,3-beta-glucanosyltransferase GAS5
VKSLLTYCPPSQGLSTPRHAIQRNAPLESYTPSLLQHYFKSLDCMAQYDNTLGLIVANEVINSIPSTPAANVVRAVTRDVKKYMAIAAELTGQRILPVGVSAAQVMQIIKPQFEFLTGGNPEEALDFYSVSYREADPEFAFRIAVSSYYDLVQLLLMVRKGLF